MSNVDVRFIFPNHDGVSVLFSTTKNARGSQLKAHLIENWPSALEPCTDLDRIRLICMGMGILKDTSPLGEKFPTFDTYPTPINVSVRPATSSSSSTREATLSTSTSTSSAGGVLSDRLIDGSGGHGGVSGANAGGEGGVGQAGGRVVSGRTCCCCCVVS